MSTSMKKYAKAILNLVIAAVTLVLVVFLLPRVIVFFMPFLIGWIIAMIASPMVRFIEEKFKIRRKAGSAFVIIVVIGIVILAAYLVGAKLIKEIAGFIQDLPNMWASLAGDLASISKKLSIIYDKLPKDLQNTLNTLGEKASEFGGELFSEISTPTIAAVGNFAKQLPNIIISIIMCLLSSYFFVAEKDQVAAYTGRFLPEAFAYRIRLIKRSMVRAIGGYLKAQIKIEIWIYLLLVIGFAILGVDYTLLIALGVAVMDFLPFFGTGTIMIPWAIVEFLSADYKMTIGLLITWGISQLVRQIIQPKIVGDSIGVPPIPTLFLLYIGYKAGGVLGMIMAVPIGIILWTMYEEGVFDTTKNSIRVLSAGLNHFRKLTPQDMYIVDTYRQECQAEFEAQQEKEEQKRN